MNTTFIINDLVNFLLCSAIVTIRRKLAALSSLFEHFCDANAVTHNPVKGVKRPKVESYEGKTPALGDGQARALLDAPGAETEKGMRTSRPPGSTTGGRPGRRTARRLR
jgi:site-specific recombinase XerD